MENQREHFASRLGFIFMTAGCAIGLGNVWRFPYTAGTNGGGFFVLLYLLCLTLFGIPVLMMELAIGRAGQSTFPGAFRRLQNPESKFKWHIPAYGLFTGNMILLMFYTVVTGWLLIYTFRFMTADPGVYDEKFFGQMLTSIPIQSYGMFAALLATLVICLGGVQKVIEKSIKIMMGGLFALLLILVINSLSLKGASEGVAFFLKPDISDFAGENFLKTLHAAMAQAFFTLSLGIGSIAICGSYINKERSLFQEGLWIIFLDTTVAISSGLIIFPACMAFGVEPDSGPPLIFITLPKVFMTIKFGFFWGSLFFLFLSVAALSTLVAVFENLVAFGIDEFKWKRQKSGIIFGIILGILSMPCILGFNLWKKFQPLGSGSSILDLEDFIVSANLLPLGSIFMLLFCMNRKGWGSRNFFTELNTGKGWKFPEWTENYIKFIVCPILIILWAVGIVEKFF